MQGQSEKIPAHFATMDLRTPCANADLESLRARLSWRLHLAMYQLEDGRKDAARSTLQALVKTSPTTSVGNEWKELLAKL